MDYGGWLSTEFQKNTKMQSISESLHGNTRNNEIIEQYNTSMEAKNWRRSQQEGWQCAEADILPLMMTRAEILERTQT